MEVKGGYWICSLKNAIRKNIDFLKLFWKAKLEEIKPFRIIRYIPHPEFWHFCTNSLHRCVIFDKYILIKWPTSRDYYSILAGVRNVRYIKLFLFPKPLHAVQQLLSLIYEFLLFQFKCLIFFLFVVFLLYD